MNSNAIRTTVLASLITASAFAVPALASADPAPATPNPLIATTCSFDQIDSALHQVAPKFAERLDNHPKRKAELADFFAKSPADRQAVIDAHTHLRDRLLAGKGSWEKKAQQVADTCSTA